MEGEIKADAVVDEHSKAVLAGSPMMPTPAGKVIGLEGEIKADVATNGDRKVVVADIPEMPTSAGEVVMAGESKADIAMNEETNAHTVNDGETKANIYIAGESESLVASVPTVTSVANSMRTLNKYSINLTKLAEEGKLDPVIGRQAQIERVTQILCRRTKSNPCLVGDPGVGKTAIVEGLAQLIVKGDVPVALQGKKCIGATTFNEYRKHIEKDSALERRFLPVKVPEPTIDETVLILKGLRERYELHHKLCYTDGALVAAAKLSYQYISDRFLPDKAIDLIDEAGSRVQMEHHAQLPVGEANELPEEKNEIVSRDEFEKISVVEPKELDKELGQITKEKNEAACNQDNEKARALEDWEMKIALEDWEMKMKSENSLPSKKDTAVPMVTEVEIRHIISMWTGIPVGELSNDESDRLLMMEETLHRRIVGQDEAVKAVSGAIRRARVGLKNPSRPIASILFLGPTGVGKSELAKALAAYYFGDGEAMIRFDMSEFAERYTVSKLIGAPPGYVGYREGGGHLTEAVRRRPFAVVLFDEVEKAHSDVRNVMLQILEDGRLTDNRGRTVDFKNTVIIMTSNVGSGLITEKSGHCMGFDQTKILVTGELTRNFSPEFLNRLDEVIVFRQLSRLEVREIADIMLKEVFERLKAKEIEVRVTQRFIERVVEEGYSPSHGARPLRGVIMRLLEDTLAIKLLAGKIKAGDVVIVDVDSGGNAILQI